ncbi:MAG: insulinase family protein [Rhodospirillales bacterium]|nr:insulinase family protein [Rhodospirillales bacterium]MCB9997171.1 insulinase family protein [Rhodospirillales bacterium]
MSIEVTKLPNGVRVITDYVPAVESVAVGVWVDVGTRHEDMAHNGVAHMVEHMMFKGTPTRTAAQIAEQIENVGGQMNAYTSREITSYHMHLLKEDLPLALDVLADIMQRPTMPEDEVERERGVILQEIGMTLDTPDDWVFDLYQETAYPGQALGAPILGRDTIIRNMKRDTLLDYVARFYTPARLVIGVAGNATHETVSALVEKLFGELPEDRPGEAAAASYKGGEHREEKTLEQSHVLVGFQGVSRKADDYYAAVLLSIILGGGMSSRLFQEVREKRGLVYSVFSHHAPYQDDGQFVIYAGTGPDKLPELMPVLCDEIGKIRTSVSGEELKRAKAQIRAEILMGQESMMRRVNQQAKHMIHFGAPMDLQHKISQIEAVSAADVTAVAAKIFAGTPTLTALGPLGTLESYDDLKRRLAA